MPLSLSLGLGLSSRNTGGGFSLAAFMAAQEDGFWYDFGQTDRLFQEDIGPTPANDPNEVIGLALSSRLWGGKTLAAYLAAQPELMINGDFSSGLTGWVVNAVFPNTVTVDGGGARVVCDGTITGLTRAIPTTIGRILAITFTVVSVLSGGVTLAGEGGLAIKTFVAPGTYTVFHKATQTNQSIEFKRSGGVTDFTVDNVSVKEVSRYAATQVTASFKPKFQPTGAAFDGTDDNLLTGYTAGPGANFIVAKVAVPPVISANQTVAGVYTTVPGNGFSVTIATNGALRIIANSGSSITVPGAPDMRGTDAVIALSNDGTTMRGFVNDAQVYSGATAGVVPTSSPIRIGSLNLDGAASGFFGGSIKSIVAGRQFLDLATFKKIAAAL